MSFIGTGEKFRSQVEDAGATFEPFCAAYDFDESDYDAAFPDRSALHGLRQIRWDFQNIFIRQAGPQYCDLRSILDRWPAAVVIGIRRCSRHLRSTSSADLPTRSTTSRAWASRGTASRHRPRATPRHIAGRAAAQRDPRLPRAELSIPERLARVRVAMQADRRQPRKFTGVLVSPYLFIQPTVEAFEYPRRDLPPQVHFIGTLLPESPAEFRQPDWWHEVANKTRPVVLITQAPSPPTPGP